MLADTRLNPLYRKDKSDLMSSTARALTLGNDITAYGWHRQAVEDTKRSFHSLRAVYKAKQVLPGRPRLSSYLHTVHSRKMFFEYYDLLRFMGQSRRQILQVAYEELGIDK